MKKVLTGLLVCSTLLTLTACGSEESSKTSNSEEPKKETVKPKKQTYTLGSTVEYAGIKVKLLYVNFDYKKGDFVDPQPKGGHNVNIGIEVQNNSKFTFDPNYSLSLSMVEDGVEEDDSSMTTIGVPKIDNHLLLDVNSMAPKSRVAKWEILEYKLNSKDHKLKVRIDNPSEEKVGEFKTFTFDLNKQFANAPK